MAKKRRNSIPLEAFQKAINDTVATDQSHSEAWRQGLCVALRKALQLANNYGGWEFIDEAGLDYKVVQGELRSLVKDATRRRFYTLDEVEDQARQIYTKPTRTPTQQSKASEAPPEDRHDRLEVENI